MWNNIYNTYIQKEIHIHGNLCMALRKKTTGKTLEQALQKWGYPNTNMYMRKARLSSLQTIEVHIWTREILLHIIRVWLSKTKTDKGKNCDYGD